MLIYRQENRHGKGATRIDRQFYQSNSNRWVTDGSRRDAYSLAFSKNSLKIAHLPRLPVLEYTNSLHSPLHPIYLLLQLYVCYRTLLGETVVLPPSPPPSCCERFSSFVYRGVWINRLCSIICMIICGSMKCIISAEVGVSLRTVWDRRAPSSPGTEVVYTRIFRKLLLRRCPPTCSLIAVKC